MCGITFTTCSKKTNSSKIVYAANIQKLIEKIIQSKNNDKNIEKLLNLVWIFKNDISFLNYYESKKEQSIIKKCCLQLKKFLLTADGDKAKKIKDIKWILDEELKIRFEFVKSYCKGSKIDNSTIIFFKTLNSVVNSINLLETRGRDSLGLQLSILLDKDKNNIDLVKDKKFENNLFVKVKKNKIFINKIYKTYNIFGSLGDNMKIILNMFKKDQFILSIIKGGLFENINITTHTRWASVGEVNLANTHPVMNSNKDKGLEPLIFSVMNGDIQNHEEIISSIDKFKIHNKDKNLSDTLALSLLFSQKLLFTNIKKIKEQIKKTNGSFASISISDEDISKIILIKKGNAGIYYGKNEDRIFFSSDVYGLVEETRKIFEVKKDTFSVVDCFDKKSDIEFYDIFSKSKTKIKRNLLINVNLNTRDVSKKNFPYFLEKEIYETEDITVKTINTYLHPENLIYKKNSLFIKKSFNQMSSLIGNFRNNKIDHIIITGMGTCYTAASHIASYMSEKLSDCLPNVKIESQLASEASAFSLKKIMKKTLVIAIAQSGTTKDTNVFLDLVKKRGAKTACFLNKRNGDISYISDLVFYIGDGRDIEIAVPSTKTFTAHLLLGFIFTLYIKEKIKRKKVNKDLINIYKIPKIVSKTIKNFEKLKNSKIFALATKYKNWFISYDDISKKFSSEEIRIKLSECCYKSLSNLNIEKVIDYKVGNSLIIYNIGFEGEIFKKNINLLTKLGNTLILIGSEKKLKGIKTNSKIFKLLNPDINQNFDSIPTVINGQLLSFNIAKSINQKSKIFKFFKKSIINNYKKKLVNKYCLKIQNDNNFFQEKKVNKIINDIKKDSFKNKKKLLKNIDYLESFTQRPIDTIKHQAKTITVGTERNQDNKNFFLKPKKNKFKHKFKNILQKNLRFCNFKNITSIAIIKNENYNFFSQFIYGYIKNYLKSNNLKKNIYFCNKKDKKLNTKIIYLQTYKNENSKNLFLMDFKIIYNLKSYNFYGNKIFNNYLRKHNSIIMKNFKNMIHICNIILSNLSKKSDKKFETYKSETINSLENAINAISKKKVQSKISSLKIKLNNTTNLKILGGGINFYAAEFLSHLITCSKNRSCGYDTLESHKHIDMSAEPIIITLMANMFDPEYLKDCSSELDKCISHNNEPFLVVTKDYSNLFQKVKKTNLIEIPYLNTELIGIIYYKLFEKLYDL